MPSGYNYRCRLGAMHVDGSGNLSRTLQLGARAQYTAAGYPSIASGGNGGVTTAVPLVNVTPPTSTVLYGALNYGGTQIGTVQAGPSANNPFLVNIGSSSAATFSEYMPFSMILETQNIYYNSNMSAVSLLAHGWQDKVNAN